MAKIKVNFHGLELLIDECEVYRTLVGHIVSVSELLLMLYVSFRMDEKAGKDWYQSVINFCKDGFGELEEIAKSTLDHKIEELTQEYTTNMNLFFEDIQNTLDVINENNKEECLKRLRNQEDKTYKIAYQLLDHIRRLRKKKNILKESQSQDEIRFYNKGDLF